MNEKLSVIYVNKNNNNWTVILYNYGDIPITIKEVYDSKGKKLNFNITSNPINQDQDATLTANSDASSLIIITDYNAYRVKA